MTPKKILEILDENVYKNLSLNYNSEGKLMTKNELKLKVRMIKNLILNFTIQSLIEKDVSYIEFQEAKDLMI
jgi:hypothetical protein